VIVTNAENVPLVTFVLKVTLMFAMNANFKQDVHVHGELEVCENATFKKDVCVQGTLKFDDDGKL